MSRRSVVAVTCLLAAAGVAGCQLVIGSFDVASDGGVEGDGAVGGEGGADARSDGSGGDGAGAGDADAGAPGDAATDAPLLAAPRLLSPLSTARVTSRTPTLRWAPPAGVTDATVDLCSDRACTKSLGSQHVTAASSFKPTTPLAPGVVFWRVHPSTQTASTSATWQFTVGVRSAAVSASWGTALDVNGDGFTDVAVGAPGENRVYLYLGSAAGLATTAAAVLTGPSGGGFGSSLASAGDVDGDGFADLVVGAPKTGSNAGAIYVYRGGAGGLATVPLLALLGPDGADWFFATAVTGAGDVDGDGYADVVVSGPGMEPESAGAIFLVRGGPALGASPDRIGSPGGVVASFGFGQTVAGAGDLDGDGYADVVVGVSAKPSGTAGAYVYPGSAAGLPAAPSIMLTTGGASFAAGVGDVNGDGYADILTGAPASTSTASGHAYVYLGSSSGVAAGAQITLTDPDGNASFGSVVAGAGDTNGDGYGDVIITASQDATLGTAAGRGYVYLGSTAGITVGNLVFLPGPGAANGYFGCSAASAGDVDGDGFDAVVVGALGITSNTGTASLFAGGQAGTSSAPLITLTGPGGTGGRFGGSVFGATN